MWGSMCIQIILALLGVFWVVTSKEIDRKLEAMLLVVVSVMGMQTLIILYFLGVYQ